MELLPGIEAIGLGIKIGKTLIISDVHLGIEESYRKQGVLVPRLQYKEIIDEINIMLGKAEFNKIIINGDLKHEFGTISQQEWKEVLDFIDYLKSRKLAITLIKGTHDTILGPLARRTDLEIVNETKIGDVLIAHCDKEAKDYKTLIVGHQHPVYMLTEGAKKEKYKCFVVEGNKIIMPAITPYGEGHLQEQGRIIIVDKNQKLYDFGKV